MKYIHHHCPCEMLLLRHNGFHRTGRIKHISSWKSTVLPSVSNISKIPSVSLDLTLPRVDQAYQVKDQLGEPFVNVVYLIIHLINIIANSVKTSSTW